jgi:RNA polymerase sigma-70 factor, ECF subfamily
MSNRARAPAKGLEQFEKYLRLQAQLDLPPRLRGWLDPDDAAQQTLVQALEKWDQYRGKSEAELLAWLNAILENHLTDKAREFIRHGAGLQHSLDQTSVQLALWLKSGRSTPSGSFRRQEMKGVLTAALSDLPEDQRTVVELHHIHGLTILEICERMGRSTASVAGLLRRALRTLRRRLDKFQ